MPTADEEVAMTMLSINHGAKGIMMWAFPTTPDLTDVTSKLAKAPTGTYSRYLLGAELLGGFHIIGADMIDASVWMVENSLLVSIITSAHQDTTGSVTLHLPDGMTARSIANVLWGDGKWRDKRALRNAYTEIRLTEYEH